MYPLVQCFKIFPPSHINTKFFALQLTIFTFCTSTPLYISTYSPSCHPMSNTIDQKWFYLPSIFWRHLTLTLLSHLILTRLSWLQPGKGGLHFILSDSGNYALKVFFISHYLNWIIIIDMCMQFIIVSSYDKLINNKIP